MAKPNTDLGQQHLKSFMGEAQRGVINPSTKFETTDPRLTQRLKTQDYDPSPNQALKNRRDQGMGRMGTDEYYENKEDRDGPPPGAE